MFGLLFIFECDVLLRLTFHLCHFCFFLCQRWLYVIALRLETKKLFFSECFFFCIEVRFIRNFLIYQYFYRFISRRRKKKHYNTISTKCAENNKLVFGLFVFLFHVCVYFFHLLLFIQSLFGLLFAMTLGNHRIAHK